MCTCKISVFGILKYFKNIRILFTTFYQYKVLRFQNLWGYKWSFIPNFTFLQTLDFFFYISSENSTVITYLNNNSLGNSIFLERKRILCCWELIVTGDNKSKPFFLVINQLTAHNWQKWKRMFLTCACHVIYRDEAVDLKTCKYTLKFYDLCEYVEFGAISWKWIFGQ